MDTGRDVPADFVEMGGHRFGVRMRHDERRAGGALWADGTEKVGPGVATVFRCPRAGAFAGPEAREGSLLTDPCVRRENGPPDRFLARLILEPHFQRLALRRLGQARAHQIGEVFYIRPGPQGCSAGGAGAPKGG